MPAAPCFKSSISPKQQRGDALLEALVGIILMAVIGLGLTYAATRAVASQRNMNTQSIAMTNIREQLQTQGVNNLCAADGSISVGTTAVALTKAAPCQNAAAVVITAPGVSAVTIASNAPTSFTLNTPSNDTTKALFGDDGKISVSQ